MIRLHRQPLPQALAERLTRRAAQLREHLERGEVPPEPLKAAYRDREVKTHLVAETHGKCAYCESKIPHVYFGDVEHIRPRALFLERSLDIDNLTLVCAVCNNRKSNYWDDACPLLDPYNDEPADELLALGYIIARRPGHERAKVTISRLDLNRTALVERRGERIQLLESLADQYVNAPDGSVRDLLRAELCRQAQTDQEYTFIVRAYLLAACDLECDGAA